MADCILCRPPSAKSIIYRETDNVLIVLCRLCRVPMGIFKRHTMPEDLKERYRLEEEMRDLFIQVAPKALPWKHWYIDNSIQHAPGHESWHMCPLGDMEEKPPEIKDYGF